MQLQSPPGINSAFDSQVAIQNVDSSLTSPLDVSGSNYPCHGHASQQILDSLKSVATMTANAPFDASQSFPRIYFTNCMILVLTRCKLLIVGLTCRNCSTRWRIVPDVSFVRVRFRILCSTGFLGISVLIHRS
jgi:hypothetical protein